MERDEVALGQEPGQNQRRLPECEKGVNSQNYSIQRSIEVGLPSAGESWIIESLAVFLLAHLSLYSLSSHSSQRHPFETDSVAPLLQAGLKAPLWPYRTHLSLVWPHVLFLFSHLLQPQGFLTAPAQPSLLSPRDFALMKYLLW